MNCIEILRNVCWFLCVLSSFLSLALTTTHAGHFLITPLLIINVMTVSTLAMIYVCHSEGEEDVVHFERSSDDHVYDPVYQHDDV